MGAWNQVRVDAADKYFSQFIRLRDGRCKRCGSTVKYNVGGLPVSHQASHFQGRRKEATRFDPLNVDTLCGGCHSYFGANPGEHYQWQVKTKGQETVDKLILASNQHHKKDRQAEKLYWQAEVRKYFDTH